MYNKYHSQKQNPRQIAQFLSIATAAFLFTQLLGIDVSIYWPDYKMCIGHVPLSLTLENVK